MRPAKPIVMWSTSLLFCVAALLAATPGMGQSHIPEDQPSWLNRQIKIEKKVRSFDFTITELAKLLGKSILADGEPVAQDVDLGYSGTVKEVLDRITDRFDFTWKVSSRNVILLNKRFNNPDEVPQMHLAEMQRMAKDAFTSFSQLQFDPVPAHETLLRKQLYSSLTDEQRIALAAQARLTSRDLSQEQVGLAHQAMLNNALASFHWMWQYLNDILSYAPAGTLYSEVSHLQSGARIDQTHPFYAVRFLYSTSDGRRIPAILATEKRF